MNDSGPAKKHATASAKGRDMAEDAGTFAVRVALAYIPGVGPLLAEGFSSIYQRVEEARFERWQRAVDQRLAELEASQEVFRAAAVADERRQSLVARSVQAAVQAVEDAKIEALARAMADGVVGTDSATDRALVLVALIAQLERPHVRVLAALLRERLRTGAGYPAEGLRTTGGVLESEVAADIGMQTGDAAALLAQLRGIGLATDTASSVRGNLFGGNAWTAVGYAAAVVDYIGAHEA